MTTNRLITTPAAPSVTAYSLDEMLRLKPLKDASMQLSYLDGT